MAFRRALVVLVACFLGAGLAHADSSDLRRFLDRGYALAKAGKHEQALPYLLLALEMGEVEFPPDRIQTIHNGVELSRFQGRITRDAARQELALPTDKPIVGAVGRLVPVKDHACLVEAVALLGREGLQPMLVIAGDGPLRGATEERASALGIEHQVRLLGHRNDIERVLAALDVFVLPSRSEGLNNTILEAMAAGLPVLATRVGGADEMVVDGATGLLVEAGAPEKLATALRRLLSDPAMAATMGRAGRARAEMDFDLARTVLKYERLYTDLARASGCISIPLQPSLHPAPGSGSND